MRYSPLSMVRQRVKVGEPLPFNVYNDDHTLLLAKEQTIHSVDQLQALFDRGTLVDLTELHRGSLGVEQAPASLLNLLWTDNINQVQRILTHSKAETFRGALEEAAKPVEVLIDRDPDLAILQVLRQEGNEHVRYGLNHATHTAIICRLVAKRLQWSDSEANLAFKAALTMNLSVLELQGIMAGQTTRPTEEQRRLIHSHPTRSKEILLEAGVSHEDWLRAVEQHHERGDQSGYPTGNAAPSEMAVLLAKADLYAAKLSPRAYRDSLPADRAGREIFMRDPGNPITAALVKEFGVYPPGTYVSLASYETGVVIKRGPKVMAPLVAVLTDRKGMPVVDGPRRDTTIPAYAVTGVVPDKSMRVRLPQDKLAALCAA